MNVIRDWLQRHFSDPQVVTLTLILLAGLGVVIFFGGLLTPVLAALVLAYLLEAPVRWLEAVRVPRALGAGLVSTALLVGVALASFTLLPLLTRQAAQVFQEIPSIIAGIQSWLLNLPERYPSLVTPELVDEFLTSVTEDIGSLRQIVLSRSLVLGVGLLYLAVYMILVPLMVFFFLRDKDAILAWLGGFVSRNKDLVSHVWYEVDVQLSNYVRGKAVEIVLVWIAAYLVFSVLGLKYALLLSVGVGLSVLIPYLGAMAMTLPVAAVAYAQWGLEAQTVYVLVAYGILQAIDGNVLVPILFSEAVNLHPVAIIAAVLFFGGIWGFWGVFFAIPLATLINAVINAWPREIQEQEIKE